jgi:hypothetical protein
MRASQAACACGALLRPSARFCMRWIAQTKPNARDDGWWRGGGFERGPAAIANWYIITRVCRGGDTDLGPHQLGVGVHGGRGRDLVEGEGRQLQNDNSALEFIPASWMKRIQLDRKASTLCPR